MMMLTLFVEYAVGCRELWEDEPSHATELCGSARPRGNLPDRS